MFFIENVIDLVFYICTNFHTYMQLLVVNAMMTALTEILSLLVELVHMRVELKYAMPIHEALCVMTIGVILMRLLFVDS